MYMYQAVTEYDTQSNQSLVTVLTVLIGILRQSGRM
jgi:hypothetical protein